jgi:hypothetical protein
MSRTSVRYLVLIFLSTIISAKAQKTEKNYEAKIQRITLHSKAITESIHAFIADQKKFNSRFAAGYGYLELSNVNKNNFRPVDASDSDAVEEAFSKTSLSFSLRLSTFVKTTAQESHGVLNDNYPPYYTYVDGVLVLIYDELYDVLTYKNAHGFSVAQSAYTEQSKRKLRRLMFPYLKMALEDDFVFCGLDNTEFTLSKTQREKLSRTEILQQAMFNLIFGKRYRVTYAGKVFEE